MKKSLPAKTPSALACGLLEDGNRALFLVRKNQQGIETLELPCCLPHKGENPVAMLTETFRKQTGIDAQVHDILFEKRHNIGSRKRKMWIPVLVFKMSAKSHAAAPSPDFSSCKWISSNDLAKHRLAKACEWLR